MPLPWQHVTYIVQMQEQRGITRAFSGSFLVGLVRVMVERFVRLEALLEPAKAERASRKSAWAKALHISHTHSSQGSSGDLNKGHEAIGSAAAAPTAASASADSSGVALQTSGI